MCFPWGAYLGEEGQRQGIRAMISSWRRVGPNTIPHAAKATGVYLNSMLATHEARRAGYDEAMMLTENGYVADGPGETIFMVKDGTVFTPDLSASILPGITRDTIIQIAQDLGHTVIEKPLVRTDLYMADEVFMAGTAVEITPVRSIDDHEIGVGPVTLELQKAYKDTVTGKSERWGQWIDYAPAPNARHDDLGDSLLIGVGQRRARRQAEPAREQARPRRRRRRPARLRRTAAGASASRAAAPRCPRPRAPRRIRSGSSTRMQVSQQFDRPYARLGHELDVGRAARGSAR